MAILKVEMAISTSKAASLIAQAGILVILYVRTFKLTLLFLSVSHIVFDVTFNR
jgi:hypothetical protein